MLTRLWMGVTPNLKESVPFAEAQAVSQSYFFQKSIGLTTYQLSPRWKRALGSPSWCLRKVTITGGKAEDLSPFPSYPGLSPSRPVMGEPTLDCDSDSRAAIFFNMLKNLISNFLD